ncbi:antibiotic biosynthesis monooxygenase [Microvirga antarctica]|uniref:antibiotic biosynthesis monooxygenase n=1 Tax=Microvirga antarctica TaxID=2819233 RepID=UPI001B30A7D6|nr:antibiotic biosynthesis monooxygenase [Microvirga antarctica]
MSAGTMPAPVTIVTQTQVVPGQEATFATWQDGIGKTAGTFPGFLRQTVMPPNPPMQIDWVILQDFDSEKSAVAWLHSHERLDLVRAALPMLAGKDDVHIVRDGGSGVLPAPVSAVIATRIKKGSEISYRAWEQRIAAAQSKAPGFQGYRFEPPLPGVQDDWLAIVRFDSEEHLQNWLNSPDRQKLLAEAVSFTEEFHTRIVRTGFDQWFKSDGSTQGPAAWKQNMVVLLMLYPVVFLFGIFVQTPILMGRLELPFWLALFVGNVVGVILLNWLVPWASRKFNWWLAAPGSALATNVTGAALVAGLYLAALVIFSRLS